VSKERKTQLVTLLVLAGALVFVAGQKYGWKIPEAGLSGLAPQSAPKPGPTPQDAIYAMLDAAREGQVAEYLGAYTGQMAASLEQALAESTEAKFAQYLRNSNAAIKGIAISEPQTLTEREVKVRVEYVYQDRNEAQFVYLEKLAQGWKISRVDGIERVKTLIPYGTPVQ
jgi:hypothetical protein